VVFIDQHDHVLTWHALLQLAHGTGQQILYQTKVRLSYYAMTSALTLKPRIKMRQST